MELANLIEEKLKVLY